MDGYHITIGLDTLKMIVRKAERLSSNHKVGNKVEIDTGITNDEPVFMLNLGGTPAYFGLYDDEEEKAQFSGQFDKFLELLRGKGLHPEIHRTVEVNQSHNPFTINFVVVHHPETSKWAQMLIQDFGKNGFFVHHLSTTTNMEIEANDILQMLK